MVTEFESPDAIPTVIFPEAWQAAMVIDQQVYNFMAECGLTRNIEGASKMMQVIARAEYGEIIKFIAKNGR